MSRMHDRARTERAGLSLLEVMVALLILALSVGALSHLIQLASDNAVDVRREAQASLLCQRKLAEVTIGALGASSTSYTGFPEDEQLDNWQWKLDVLSNIDGLYDVQVSVKFDSGDGYPREVTLGQKILDPGLRGSTQDARATQGNSSSASSSSTTPSTTTPSTTTPSTTTPSSTTPSTTTPSSNKTTTPSTTTPSTTTPSTTTPSSNKTTTPSTTTPSTGTSKTGKGG